MEGPGFLSKDRSEWVDVTVPVSMPGVVGGVSSGTTVSGPTVDRTGVLEVPSPGRPRNGRPTTKKVDRVSTTVGTLN